MPKRSSKGSQNPDVNENAFRVVQEATAEDGDEKEPAKPEPPPEKNPAAVALGRLGGLKGGKARAEKLSADERSEIARLAALARWKKGSEAKDGG
jgi:hypothetical protein